MSLDWERLLCDERLHGDATGFALCRREVEAPRTAAEADVQRVIFSAPFRRLAGKTQVHPFARVDYVHNRLTHSLEVAEAGAGLAQAVCAKLNLSPEIQHACRLHVRAACLGHDIGNPPFGHVGEAMLRTWTRQRQADLTAFLGDEANLLTDFLQFDGNAQTFRLLANPYARGDGYFRLTCATLGAMIKYPTLAGAEEGGKYACFQTSLPWFECIMNRLGLSLGSRRWQRHPLSYLTEIADDICYCVTDCEDAVWMGILEEQTVCEWYLQLFSTTGRSRVRRKVSVASLRAMVIDDLMRCFMRELVHAFKCPETLGEFEAHSPTWQRLKRLKEDYKIVFSDAQKQATEADAQVAVMRFLNSFFEDLQAARSGKTSVLRAKALLDPAFIKENQAQSPGWWLHLFFDTVTAMTDAHVLHIGAD